MKELTVDGSVIRNLWIEKVPTDEEINIYINSPFCYCKCRYCLYQGNLADQKTVDAFADSYLVPNLLQFKQLLTRYKKVNTVYFGGGTPNKMAIESLRLIIGVLGESFASAKARVIELNPSYLTDVYIDEINKLGFTLVTLGVQTFDVPTLIKMKRLPVNFDRINDIITRLKNGGTRYVSLDIMAFLQTYSIRDINDLEEDLKKAFQLDIDFVTVYPELNLINLDKKCGDVFKSFIKQYYSEWGYPDDTTFVNNPRLIVRYINNKHDYDFFLNTVLPYYENDFPYATMNIIGFGDFYSKQEVLSYSPGRFFYAEKYRPYSLPEYKIYYLKNGAPINESK